MPEYDKTVKMIPLVKERRKQDGTFFSDVVGKIIVLASGKTMVVVPAIGAYWRVATEKTWTPQQGRQPAPVMRQEAIIPPSSAPFGGDAQPDEGIPF